jgi:hypothetical protein
VHCFEHSLEIELRLPVPVVAERGGELCRVRTGNDRSHETDEQVVALDVDEEIGIFNPCTNSLTLSSKKPLWMAADSSVPQIGSPQAMHLTRGPVENPVFWNGIVTSIDQCANRRLKCL